ncbi:TetR/AcrR family transcriptional regulator [Lactiplantibacillus daoliensis]|uniref:TetR/AcrR family transcriptional regulator n=1 Tax=Lactiplantibacillus daoliensis TaxID=2559916 RepID=A0ABW1UFW1_9LACO|nr:TetR/AcrR family transcriptional regulator [Lactiplantibacillus daoliensis]
MTQDVRKIKTERDLQVAFIQLLAMKGFRQITVADICEASLTSRSTFYAHYLDKYDLLDQMVAHYSAIFANRVDMRFDQIIAGDIDDLVAGLSADMAENRWAVQVLFGVHEPEADLQANFRTMLLKKWQNFIAEQVLQTDAPTDLIASMGTSVQMTLIEWVISHDKATLDGVTGVVDTIRKAVLLHLDTKA